VNLLQDNSGTNPGDPLTGLAYNSTNLVCYYKSGGTGTVTALSLATQTSSGSFSLGGFAQLSSANMPGAYRLDLSTTLFSSGDNFGQVMLSGYADLAAHAIHVKFTDLDLYQSMNDALSTYGVSTMTSTDVDDSLATYGPSTHTTTDITDVLGAYGVSTLTSTNTILLSSAATSPQLVDDIWDESLTGATHNVANSAGRRLRTLQTGGNYESGYVWVDTIDGTAGTTVDENGVVTNPVDTIADALTIAAAANLKGMHFNAGSSITAAAAIEGYILEGHGWTLAMGGQSFNNSHIFDAVVSGIGTAATEMEFHNCEIGTASIQKCHSYNCTFDGTVTMTLAGNYNYIDCQSGVAGASAPTFTKTAGQAITAQWRKWSGGITVSGLEAGDTVSIDVVSGGTVTINGSGGTVVVRGTCNVVDGSSGAVTITETSVINMTKINTECDTALSDYGASTHTTTDITDTLSSYGVSTLTSTDLTDAHNAYGASTHTTTDITDVLGTYGVSTHTSTDITDALNTYGGSTHTSTDIQDLLPSGFSSVSASSGYLHSNVQAVNDVVITGDGSGTPFNVST